MTSAELIKLSAETGEATPIDLGDTLLFQDGNARAAAELILGSIPEIAAAWEKDRLDREALLAALYELVTVAGLRGDDCLPHPANDPILWTSRMQEAWDDAKKLVAAIAQAEEPK